MKPCVVASIPHTGTMFTYYLLPGKHACSEIREDHKYRVHLSDPDHWRFLDACFVIIPLRARDAVERSWTRRGLDLDQLDRLWAYMETIEGFRLPIDTPDRDDRLAQLSRLIGVDLQTDWTPVNSVS